MFKKSKNGWTKHIDFILERIHPASKRSVGGGMNPLQDDLFL